jgi:ABC-type transport system involved in cytochrome bd biosynthesis fused ATPase/permease subunit
MSESLRRASLSTLRVAFLSALVLDTLASISVALVAVPLGLRLLDGGIRLSTALAVLIIAPEVFVPLRRASAEFHESTEGLAAAAAAFTEIDGSAARGGARTSTLASRAAPDPSKVNVGLCDVTLEYRGSGTVVLESASLSISPGETVVLLGANGAGKSTALLLLLGFLDPDEGSVMAGDVDLAAIDASAWRRRIAYLPEHPTLLSGTLRENLLLARADASDAACVEALGSAGALDLLESLPDGLSTRIGEGERGLSAGQRQRIALARIHLRQASLYLLDERTCILMLRQSRPWSERLLRNFRGRAR